MKKNQAIKRERKTGVAFLPVDYADWLTGLKNQIAGARQRVALSANGEQIQLYHRIGTDILERQLRDGWGLKLLTVFPSRSRNSKSRPASTRPSSGARRAR